MDVIIIPFVFGVIGAVIVLIFQIVTGVNRRKFLHLERMAALDKGVPLPDDVLADAAVEVKQRTGGRSAALQGTIWTALGVGLMAGSHAGVSPELGHDMRQFMSFLEVWAYPATSVGVGLLLFGFFTREKQK